VVITATNHAELLDRAVWRRFQLRLSLPAPTVAQMEDWFTKFQDTLGEPLGISAKSLATRLQVSSFSDLEQFCTDIHRRFVLSLPKANLKSIIAERLEQWQHRFTIK
jgi:SpoVK/Ycf46/Vps4 family AAA+-type ATPase